jgi:hypothetical protein
VTIVTIGTETYRQVLPGQFCSAVNTPATFTQAWLKTDAVMAPAGGKPSGGAR